MCLAVNNSYDCTSIFLRVPRCHRAVISLTYKICAGARGLPGIVWLCNVASPGCLHPGRYRTHCSVQSNQSGKNPSNKARPI